MVLQGACDVYSWLLYHIDFALARSFIHSALQLYLCHLFSKIYRKMFFPLQFGRSLTHENFGNFCC
jgi:hypothetical protein